MKARLEVKTFIQRVAGGERFRVIDFRGDYWRTIPGAIPVQFDFDIFFEEAGWTQDMLGVPFQTTLPVLLVCDSGGKSDTALTFFKEKNPMSPYTLYSLKGGWTAYVEQVRKLTEGFKQQQRFTDELTDLRTDPERFQQLLQGLLKHRKVGLTERLLHPGLWFGHNE
ncbi:MAG: hypothetical protein HQL51_08635 [Magnetococcales bacterium]|nr:hypothetical protein [Magnetococcales bacterium]